MAALPDRKWQRGFPFLPAPQAACRTHRSYQPGIVR